MNFPVLHTARLVLRRPDAADAAAATAFLRSERSAFMGGPYPGDDAGAEWGQVLSHWATRGYGLFAVTLDGAAIGLAGPWRPDGYPEGEIGWNLWSAGHEGQGFATEAAACARAWAFDTLGWDTAVSYTHPDNFASHRLAERLGAVVDPDAATPYPPPVRTYRHRPDGPR